MIVVAIIGILSAIAIPSFAAMQARARFVEAPVNYDGLRAAQLIFLQASKDIPAGFAGSYSPRPTASLDKGSVPWVQAGDWAPLGWAPDGSVRCTYSAPHVASAGPPQFLSFDLKVSCDVDGDGVRFHIKTGIATRGDQDQNVDCEGGSFNHVVIGPDIPTTWPTFSIPCM